MLEENQTLAEAGASTQAESDEVRGELELRDAAVTVLKQSLTDTQDLVVALRLELEEALQSNQTLGEEGISLKSTVADQEGMIAILESDLMTSQDALALESATNLDLTEALAAAEQQIASLQTDLDAARLAAEDQQLNFAVELEAQQLFAENQAAKLAEEISAKQLEIDQLTADLEAQQGANSELNAEIATAQDTITALETAADDAAAAYEALREECAAHTQICPLDEEELISTEQPDATQSAEGIPTEETQDLEPEAETEVEVFIIETEIEIAPEASDAAGVSAELEALRAEPYVRVENVANWLADKMLGREDQSVIQFEPRRFSLLQDLLFDSNSATLKAEGELELRRLAFILEELESNASVREEVLFAGAEVPVDWVLQIGGHADPRPINGGPFADNWELASERALTVLRYLIDQGVPAYRLQATSFGDQKLVDGQEENDDVNRRISFTVAAR